MRFWLILLAALAMATAVRAQDVQTVTFVASEADWPNPERGFYRVIGPDLARASGADMAEAFAAGFRLVYVKIDLEPWREAALPESEIQALDAAFGRARRTGIKLIVRASYNDPQGETGYRDARDAPLAIVERHLAQLTPVFAANQDVIAVVQAGLIGAWGEWHTSSNGLATPENKLRVKDALMAAVPQGRFVQFRYPPDLIAWRARPEGRVGFHNDCFLASDTDVGTYDEDPALRARQRAVMQALGDIAPFGGETCNPADEAGARPRADCADILGEGAAFNLTYLNDSYYRRAFHERWIAGGCMDQVRRSMGYRFALGAAEVPHRTTPGARFEVSLAVQNLGWSRPMNARPVEIVLVHAETGEVRRLPTASVDARDWGPGETAAGLGVTSPVDLAPGRWRVLLALPDADPRLAGDARYAIRFANADDAARRQGWDAALGAFALGVEITVD
ncbi:DUF4832 domain-containing protein [Brevundimonas sp. Leaf363]|uniref:DUF4832 domain-containing protein n=1 Tax=Brevundimonas sp. Leaf363 TaxID=1736353 RepID=UPI000A84362E|nr:DUF4832 domain-containing protein [Brevundimonas sp. Leaf363]